MTGFESQIRLGHQSGSITQNWGSLRQSVRLSFRLSVSPVPLAQKLSALKLYGYYKTLIGSTRLEVDPTGQRGLPKIAETSLKPIEFSGTVPIFNDVSLRKITVLPGRPFISFLAWCPGFVPIFPFLKPYAHASVAKN